MNNGKISAMIFAAGLGTRLYPLTSDRPKALVEIGGTTLLELTIRKLIDADLHHIVINVHHFGEKIIDFIEKHHFDADIAISDEREELLDTGGGLKFAEPLFQNSENILLYNVDILTDLDLHALLDFHRSHEALATLAVRQRQTSRYFLFDTTEGRLCGWRNRQNGEERIASPSNQYKELAFSGIHVVNKKIFDLIPTCEKKSITPIYLDLAPTQKILAYEHSDGEWCDVGKLDVVKKLNGEL